MTEAMPVDLGPEPLESDPEEEKSTDSSDDEHDQDYDPFDSG